jgi:hypothetical protein
LYDAIYTPALPWLNSKLGSLISLTQDASSATEHHSAIAKVFAYSMIGAGDGMYYALQGASAFGTLAFGLGQTIKMASDFGAVTKLAALGTQALDGRAVASERSNGCEPDRPRDRRRGRARRDRI